IVSQGQPALSSTSPLQSLSLPSQVSLPLGLAAMSLSLQSRLFGTSPAMAPQPTTGSAVTSPYESLSTSGYSSMGSKPSSICSLQLLSTPSQTSAAPAFTSGSSSSQSAPAHSGPMPCMSLSASIQSTQVPLSGRHWL